MGRGCPQGWNKVITPLAARLEEKLGFGVVVWLLHLLGEVDGVRSLVKTISSPLGVRRSTEWSQPPAAILRPCGMFLSPATPALPSILAARVAVNFSAISFLLYWRTLASPGGAGAGVQLWQPANPCGWGWLAPTPLWERLENSSVLGDLALLALS